MSNQSSIYARILDAKYIPEFSSFILSVEDCETHKILKKPLQITKITMMKMVGINPDDPRLTDNLMHSYADMLKNRSKDNPIRIESAQFNELEPLIKNALQKSDDVGTMMHSEEFEEFKKKSSNMHYNLDIKI
jgi:hypothetical protein